MNWIKNLHRATRLLKVIGSISTSSAPGHSLVNKQQYDVLLADKFLLCKKVGLAKGDIALAEHLASERKPHWRSYGVNACYSNNNSVKLSRKFVHAIHNGPNLSRGFLAQLKRIREKRKQKSVEHSRKHETEFGTKAQHGGYFSGSSVNEDGRFDCRQVATEPLDFASLEEVWRTLLSRSNLLITKDETDGFEREHIYAIADVSKPQVPAGFIRLKNKIIVRQLVGPRWPFVASITNGDGLELFRIRRPFWWINSSIYVEVGGKEIGAVHRRWPPWRRVYELYLGNEQFAVLDNRGFVNWTFTLTGINGEAVAEIKRVHLGFYSEVFANACQYDIRFGSVAVNDTMPDFYGKDQKFKVARQLTMSERALTVALALSLEDEHFSVPRYWLLPLILWVSDKIF